MAIPPTGLSTEPADKNLVIRRWLIVTVSCGLFILSQFYRASIAVISPDLVNELGLDALELSTISAAFFYAFALMQIPVGLLIDSTGPRKTMTVLTLVSVAGAIMFSFGESAGWLSVGRAMLGIGMACNFMGTLKLLTTWFGPKQFATLSALIVSMGTIGNIAAATPLVLMVRSWGWRNSFEIMAGITAVLAGLFFLVVRDRPEGNEQASAPVAVPGIRETASRAMQLFHRRDFWIISASTFCRYGIYAAVQALWAGPYLINVIQVSPVVAGNILFLMSIGLILGSPVSGYLSDAVFNSRKTVIIAGLGLMVLLLFILATLSKDTDPLILSCLFFTFGAAGSTGQVMYAHIKEQVPTENAGMAMTAINFFTMAGVAVFLQGLGAVMTYVYPDNSLSPESFHTAFILCAVILLVIAGMYTLTTETRSRNSGQ